MFTLRSLLIQNVPKWRKRATSVFLEEQFIVVGVNGGKRYSTERMSHVRHTNKNVKRGVMRYKSDAASSSVEVDELGVCLRPFDRTSRVI